MWHERGANWGNCFQAWAVGVVLNCCSASAFSQMQDGIIVMDESLENPNGQEQQKLARNELEGQQDYAVLNHAFFENDVVKIYNYTAYEAGSAQNKFLLGHSEQIGLQDFGISFGFGLELRLNGRQSIGYEYLSNFPYDRGQIIRFYWHAKF
ncbi:hypothetical protein [Acinetobacter sp.]|uniref:hypothetical protein n=1 Tax=Acinetobacter sp. TaxID=472 RepID=UPI0035B4B28F